VAELEARGVAAEVGCASTAVLLSERLRIGRREAAGRVRLAAELGPRRAMSGEALPARFPQIAVAVAEGAIGDRHAALICRTIDGLPDAVLGQAGAVEATLVEHARTLNPDQLAVLARTVRSCLDPDNGLVCAASLGGLVDRDCSDRTTAASRRQRLFDAARDDDLRCLSCPSARCFHFRHGHRLGSQTRTRGRSLDLSGSPLGFDPAERTGDPMKRVVQVVALSGLMTLVAGWLAAAPAGAAAPQVTHTKVNVTLTGIDVCGFTVDSVVQGTDTFKVFFDRFGNLSIQDVSHVVSTLTNVANGKVVYVSNAGRDAFTPDGVVNPDGTITFTDTLTGMPLRVYTAHSSTLVKDVGFLSMVATFDAQGNVLSEQVIEHGPHPFAGDFTVFCDAIASAIG
jgi:hypothetical protein